MFREIVSFLQALSLAHWILLALYSLLLLLAREFVFGRWLLRRQRKFYRNLKRPILILLPVDSNGAVIPGGDMQLETQLLRDNGFLNTSGTLGDFRAFDPTGKHCVVVMGYKDGMVGIDDILAKVKTNHVPLIVYTFGKSRVEDQVKTMLDSYPYTLYANFPITLLNQLFATVASYPYERK